MSSTAIDRETLNVRRALATFVGSYIAITVLAFGLYLLIAVIQGTSLSAGFDIRRDPSYLLAEKLYPLLNLGVWGLFAAVYFRRVTDRSLKQAWLLGCFWLAVALPLDLVCFVLVPNPLQVSARGFYVDQFPWIYLTYLVVAISPALSVVVQRTRRAVR